MDPRESMMWVEPPGEAGCPGRDGFRAAESAEPKAKPIGCGASNPSYKKKLKKERPATRGAPKNSAESALRGSGLGVDDLRRAGTDRDLARLHGLGNLADEIDVKQSVLQARALDLDVVGELEAALEGTRG